MTYEFDNNFLDDNLAFYNELSSLNELNLSFLEPISYFSI